MASRKTKAKKTKKKKSGWFFKFLISGVVLHGMWCVSMSYMLAWRDHLNIVETVSSTIVSQIIAPVIVYGATKTIENIFSKNKLSFSEPIKDTPEPEEPQYDFVTGTTIDDYYLKENNEEDDGQLTFLPEFENQANQ